MFFPLRFLRRPLTALVLVCLTLASGHATPEWVTPIAEIRSLSRQEAAKGITVRVRGVVTWQNRWNQLTIQDDTAGIWVNISEAEKRQLLISQAKVWRTVEVGHLVELEGVTDPAGYAPVILPRTIRILGKQALPRPRPIDYTRFYSGADDSQRIQVRGIVQSYQPISQGWLIQLTSTPGRFSAVFTRQALPDPTLLMDAMVTITGVASSRFNTRGELTLPRVFCSQPDQIVIERPGRAAFDAPLVPLDQLHSFRPEPFSHRLRVVGTVIYALPGKFFYIQEDTCAVRVETRSEEKWQAGDRVMVSGFVDMARAIGTITEAQVRKVGTGPVPAAIAISPREIIRLNYEATTTGQMAHPHDFDGHLVRFRAHLLATPSAPQGEQSVRQLTLQHGEMILTAVLHAGDTARIDALQPDTELDVTGIVQLVYSPTVGSPQFLSPARLDVILRSADDLVVVRAPSWWTARRLLATVALIAAALGAAMLWVWQLRRQVQRKTHLLASEMRARRDAAIEFQATLRERNRLAANLHDTLLQTLGGIGFQIEACEAEAAAIPGSTAIHLPVARKMLDHAMDELRGSVWALRSLPLHGLALPEALRSLVERAGAGSPVKIEVHTEGDLTRVPEFVAGNLLLAAQEAVHNALKHAQAHTIRIEARPAEKPDWIAVTIKDDGRGFTPGTQMGASQGHFGLVGMRERIERLNGTLSLTSAPGQGTTVHLEVPLLAYDEELV